MTIAVPDMTVIVCVTVRMFARLSGQLISAAVTV